MTSTPNVSIEKTALISVFLVIPLLVTPMTTELFEFPKVLWLQLCAVIIAVCYLIRKIDGFYESGSAGDGKNPKTRPRSAKDARGIIFLSGIAFAASLLLSTIFSSHLRTSIFGYYTRFYGGLTTYLSLVVILISLWSNLKKDSRFFPQISLAIKISVLLVASWGVLEHFGIDKKFWSQDVTVRVFSTIGQPNWLAAFLVTSFFPILSDNLTSPKKTVGAALAVVAYASLWFTSSLSGLLGLLGGLLVWGVLTPPSNFKKNRRWLMATAGICLLISVAQPGLMGQRVQRYLKQISIKEAAAQGQNTTEKNLRQPGGDTMAIRKAVWEGTINLITSNPKNLLIGTGPGTFAYTFLPFRPLALNRTSEWDLLYNKAHNELLNITAEQGLLGLISYSAFIISVLIRGIKYRKTRLVSGFVGGWVGLHITNLVGFTVVPTAILLWAYPVLQEYAINQSKTKQPKPKFGSVRKS